MRLQAAAAGGGEVWRPDTLELAAFEALERIRARLPVDKPCIAWHLAGYQLDAARHKTAFTLAMELRRLGLKEKGIERELRGWARSIGYSPDKAAKAAASAFRRKPNGEFRWAPPGRMKKPGSPYHEALWEICAAVRCPDRCPAFSKHQYRDAADTLERFELLGWPGLLGTLRLRLAAETYRAICRREVELSMAPGTAVFVTHAQLAERAQVDRRTVSRHLRALEFLGLIQYEPGSGEAGNRRSSQVQRVVPVPPAQLASRPKPLAAIRTAGMLTPDIGGATPLRRQPASVAA